MNFIDLLFIIILFISILILFFFTKNKRENFIVADAHDLRYKDLRKDTELMSDSFPVNQVISEDKNKDNIYVNKPDIGWSSPRKFVSCENKSIQKQVESGSHMLKPFPISCNKDYIKPEDYWDKYYRKIVVPIEDYKVRGFNYMDYNDSVTPYQIGHLWLLSQNTKGLPKKDTKFKNIPVGFNYSFHNTPAMPMP